MLPDPNTSSAHEAERNTEQPSEPPTPPCSHVDPEILRDTVLYQTPRTQPSGNEKSVPTTFGRYRVMKELGRGGFGIVFAGFDEQLQRKVAIKVSYRFYTHDEAAESIAEARRLAQFRHPGIVTVFDVGVQDGRCYIVSDLIEGGSLEDWLKTHRPHWRETARIAAELADALAHAHAALTVHRDVKPSNVILTTEGRPILLDFGLGLTEADAATHRGEISGTPCYMSPEQARGQGHRVDGRTDIYSLGVILYRMLTGRQPFRALDPNELMRQVIEDEAQPPRQLTGDIPAEIERICLKAMAKRLHERYTTAADLAADLRALLTPPERVAAAPEATPVPALHTPPRLNIEAERRQVTLLVLGLEWTTPDDGGEEVDAEVQHARLETFHRTCTEIVAAYEGHTLSIAGPAFMACFGYPTAFEDASRRAVRAALEALEKAAATPDAVPWAAVHTGLAIVGGTGTNDANKVTGEAMMVAARLETLAQPNAVLVTEPTLRLVREFFVYEPAGRHTLRGTAKPLELFRIVRTTAITHRLDNAGAAELTSLVGRDQEVGLLLDRWEQTQEQLGQVVLLVGEPGIGKSRLVHTLRQRVLEGHSGDPAALEWRCTAYHRNSSLFPIVDYFERLLNFQRDDAPADRLERLAAYLTPLGLGDAQNLPLFAALLSLPLQGRCPPLDLSPQRQKERTLEALAQWLRVRAERRPLLFVVEDLHWIDPSTLEFLTSLLPEIPSLAVLLVLTYRPEFTPPWSGQANQTQIALHRLTRRHVAALIARKAGIADVPPGLVEQIVARTDGVPLFVEEFTQMLVEAGRFTSDSAAGGLSGVFHAGVIPATLQELLLARLDRITTRREVVQLASTLGREFPYELLRAVASTDETTLREELTKLVKAEILYPKGRPPHGSYLFKHSLLQDAAYHSLLKTKRQEFHRRVGEVLEEHFPDTVETQPEVVAQHYTEAGLHRPAVIYWEKAGVRSQNRHAHNEAIGHFNRGLELSTKLEAVPERDGQELRLQLPLSLSLMAAKGYAAPEIGPVQSRARDLCLKLGPQAPLFHVLWGMWAWRFIHAELDRCLELADEIMPLAEALNDRGILMEAHFVPACTLFYRGDFAGARRHGDLGFTYWERESSEVQARLLGQNDGVGLLCYSAIPLWYLGYPEQALRRAEQATALLRELKHPMTSALGTYNVSFVKQLCGLGPETEQDSLAEIALCTEQGYPFWRGMGLVSRGAARLLQDDAGQAVDLLRQGIAAVQATGAEITLTHYWGCLAEALGKAGRRAEALDAVEQGFSHMNRTSSCFAQAELLRIRGELLAHDAAQESAAETNLRHALDTARQQQARSLELRAALSLNRFLQPRNRAAEGRELLEGVFQWFTEGFETRDLREARRLLQGSA